jgi:hypothetical protein
MTMYNRRIAFQQVIALTIALAFTAGAHAAPVTAPFEPDFTQSDSVDDFNEIQDVNWTLNTGAGVYNNFTNAGNNPVSAAVQVTNLPTGSNFVMSAQFTLNSFSGIATTFGFGALSPDGNLADGSGAYYLADVAQTGRIRILELNPNAGGNTIENAIPDLVTGTLYTMTLGGVYTGGNLKLTFTVFDGVNTASVSRTDTASILSGQYFGLRNRSDGSTAAFNADFSQFSILAPTPAALPAGLGLLALTVMRRRRSMV